MNLTSDQYVDIIFYSTILLFIISLLVIIIIVIINNYKLNKYKIIKPFCYGVAITAMRKDELRELLISNNLSNLDEKTALERLKSLDKNLYDLTIEHIKKNEESINSK